MLERFVQLYLYDLSWVDGWDVDEDGSFAHGLLHGCWTDPRRHPFVIRCANKPAGFAIVDEAPTGTDVAYDYDMAEFFILRRWRRLGAGRNAFRQLAALFPGRWQVRPFPGYEPADRFWSAVCADVAIDGVSRQPHTRPGKPAFVLRLRTGT